MIIQRQANQTALTKTHFARSEYTQRMGDLRILDQGFLLDPVGARSLLCKIDQKCPYSQKTISTENI